MFNSEIFLGLDMPKGLKDTSGIISISFGLDEAAANTYTQEQINLQLNPLDNEVFVVLGVDLDPEAPDAIAATNTTSQAGVTKTSQTAPLNLSSNDLIAVATRNIRAAGFVDSGVGFTHTSIDTPSALLEYVDILATNDFFVYIVGAGNANPKGVSGRMWGYRAKADAATYAALVQSEVLSA
tara:strand:+ start:44 stop:589 length:546 start_codon:yes stop_codon:yes gene_type:complete